MNHLGAMILEVFNHLGAMISEVNYTFTVSCSPFSKWHVRLLVVVVVAVVMALVVVVVVGVVVGVVDLLDLCAYQRNDPSPTPRHTHPSSTNPSSTIPAKSPSQTHAPPPQSHPATPPPSPVHLVRTRGNPFTRRPIHTPSHPSTSATHPPINLKRKGWRAGL